MNATKSDEATVPRSALCDCIKSLEKEATESRRRASEYVASEAYGEAQYHQGKAHAYTLAKTILKPAIEEAKNHAAEQSACWRITRKPKDKERFPGDYSSIHMLSFMATREEALSWAVENFPQDWIVKVEAWPE